MDTSLAIKARQPLHKSYAPRDPMPVRGVTAAELDVSKRVAGTAEDAEQDRRREDRGRDPDPHQPEHAPHDILDDPESGELILREREEAEAADRPHPDQALLRLRAYSRPQEGPAPAAKPDEHADIEA